MTKEHKYTINEIDDLRQMCRHKIIWGTYRAQFPGPRSASVPSDTDVRAEEMVRTLMLAGIKPSDINE